LFLAIKLSERSDCEKECIVMFKESIAARAVVIVGVLVVLTSYAVLMRVPGMAEADTARESEAASDLKRSKVISGVVRDEAGKLVSRALVLPLPHGGYPAETDASGAFELEGPSRDRLILTLFVRSPERNLAVAVDLEGQSIPLDVALAPGASLTGRVVDDSGAPVAGADVQPRVRIETYWAGFGYTEFRPTDSAGRYELRALPVGYEYVIHASADGYGGDSMAVGLLSQPGYEELEDLVLQAPITFKGRVVQPDGRGVRGATVRLLPPSKIEPVKTKADGTFELPLGDQRPGDYERLLIEVRHEDMHNYRGILDKPFQSKGDAQGAVRMKRTAVVRGRVVETGGTPLETADVIASIRFPRAPRGQTVLLVPDRKAVSDAKGRYEIQGIACGVSYSVEARAEGYGRNIVEDFSVAEAEAYTLRDLVLQPADMSIEGLVFDQYGEPAVNAHVLVSGRATVATFTRTDEKGRYRLDNIVNEEVLIQVSSPTHEYPVKLREARAGDTYADVMIVREVGAEEREELQLAGKDAPELEVAAWVHGEPPSAQWVTGKIVLLAFWDSGHESSSEITARLKSLAEEHGDVLVIAVHAANGDPEALQELVGKEGVEFGVALDAASYTKYPGATFEKYKVIRVPAVFIIDAEGKVRYQDIALEAVEEAVKRLLDEQ